MLSPEQQKVIEQVQKLLALSKSANQNEAALALAKAEELLEKYRLDMTQIEMMTGQKEEIVQDEEPLFDSPNIEAWESKLANGIAHLYGCAAIRVHDTMMKIVGRPSDIIFVRYLTTYITLELFRLSVDPLYKKRKSYKDSWFLGAVEVILKRLRLAKAETQNNFNNPFAVATVNNRAEESAKKLKEIYPNLIPINYSEEVKIRAEAYALGQIAGHKIKLSQDKKLNTKSTLK
jgi:hypothetical protein